MPVTQTSFSKNEFVESLRRNPDWPVLYAEGDSWFAYPLNPAGNVIRHLAKGRRCSLWNRSQSGATASEVFGVKQRKGLIGNLKQYPIEVLLFSGGGNDLAGNEFLLLLNDWKNGMTRFEEAIDQTAADHFFGLIRNAYEELIDIRDKYRPEALILTHQYDLAYPDGRKALKRLGPLGVGPWLEPSLKARGIPERKRRAITSWFLKRHKALLAEFESSDFVVAKTQGVLDAEKRRSKQTSRPLKAKDLWDNELHPTKRGFKLIADQFRKVLHRRYPDTF